MPIPRDGGRRIARTAAAFGGAVILLCTTACGITLGAPTDPMREFVKAVNDHELDRAASMTDDPEAAEKALTATFRGMGNATAHLSTLESLRGTLTTHTSWKLPDGYKTETTGTIDRLEDGKVPWSPHIIDSRLQPGGRLVYSQDLDLASPVIDRNRNDLMRWQTVTDVAIALDATADDIAALADVLHGVDPSITAESITEGMAEAEQEQSTSARDAPAADAAAPEPSRYVVVTLRPEDVDPLRADLDAIASVALPQRGRLLTVDPAVHSPALDGIPNVWRSILSRSAGWSVDIDNPGYEQDVRVQAKLPEDVQNVPTTMDLQVQKAAQGAVDSAERPAAIVALTPSNGGVSAVAQNAAASARGPVALNGLYAPGSVFSLVTVSAALGGSGIAPDDIVGCPAQVTVDGRTVFNPDDLDLGPVTLTQAFAAPCLTTLATITGALPDGALPGTAEALGVGADFDTPGLTTLTGSVPPTEPGAARIEAGIGQGQVAASPFGMAVVAATLADDGDRFSPILVVGRKGSADDPPATVSEGTAKSVRLMMNEAVAAGNASALRDIDGLSGVAGTADVTDRRAHGWFIGILGDMAFSVFVQGADSTGPATDVTRAFLDALGATPGS
ncbi:penicillin-binding transpeptidase domain-containing protein [Tomitella fengzijianii]|uniref:Penicillin-binding protein n=1 Tax=Tomitella fengzijianii TaxID=2597660 RepID=A0A516X0H9_9ACTN|nr:penicillin-binding transpeptidase domain-containing protein [Tomitella fengzijianii]QDQ96604.1 penicillin-binding protein [Tomitella fengzijianii]